MDIRSKEALLDLSCILRGFGQKGTWMETTQKKNISLSGAWRVNEDLIFDRCNDSSW
jgi:hypothetical protein